MRALCKRYPWLVALCVGASLLVKLLVPAGFMPALSNGLLVIQICTGQGAQTVMLDVSQEAGDHQEGDHHKKAEMPCAFSGLSAPALAGAHPILLAIAIAFIIATSFRAAPPLIPWRRVYLRPPSQGPPILA